MFPSDVFHNWLQLSQFNYLYRTAQNPLLQLHGLWFQMLSNAQVNDPSVPVVNKRVRQAGLDPVFKTARHAKHVLRNQSEMTAVKIFTHRYTLQSTIPQLFKEPSFKSRAFTKCLVSCTHFSPVVVSDTNYGLVCVVWPLLWYTWE